MKPAATLMHHSWTHPPRVDEAKAILRAVRIDAMRIKCMSVIESKRELLPFVRRPIFVNIF
jgi:hypothetical protein